MEAPAATAPTPSPVTPSTEATVPGGVITKRGAEQAFTVHLDNFEGPFDLLLGLISKHQLDITEIALAKVTDEFMVHLRALQASEPSRDSGQTSEFLLVAATLLDIKASGLLPNTGDGDEEDLELIEARDLLFARLMQYRAFKDVAAQFGETLASTGRMTPRQAGLEPHPAALLPELVMSITPEQLAMIAARALTPKEPETVGLTHLHAPAVSVREQAVIVVDRLRAEGALSFRSLVRDAGTTLVVVARFLALLELFRDKQVTFDQPEAPGDLEVSWTGSREGTVDVGAEFDEGEPAPPSSEEKKSDE
ncbi:segregation and condensation protein A [Janibacter limosus]|uniref:segregation and condensation protein A n=1 Tax=Janibacter limosus TaxID=53458 RepID=UPI0035E21C06